MAAGSRLYANEYLINWSEVEQLEEETEVPKSTTEGIKVWAMSSWADRNLCCKTPPPRRWNVCVVHWLGQERRNEWVGWVSAWAWNREMLVGNEEPGLGIPAVPGCERCHAAVRECWLRKRSTTCIPLASRSLPAALSNSLLWGFWYG